MHGPVSPAGKCPYCDTAETPTHTFNCAVGHAAQVQRRHNSTGDNLEEGAIKLAGWHKDDIVSELSMHTIGITDDGANSLRPDRYYIDHENLTVIPVELKACANLPEAIEDANSKYGPICAAQTPFTLTLPPGPSADRIRDEQYRLDPHLHIYAMGTWLSVPGESLATMDRLGIPLQAQDKVLTKTARAILGYNAEIENRRFPRGGMR